MPLPERCVHWTLEEYLTYEACSGSKHEFYNGEIYAMAGATLRHNTIAMNTGIALGNMLHGKPCRVFNSDQRIYVPATGLYTYSDGGVLCGKAQYSLKDPEMSLLNPVLLFEVLSPSTMEYDRGSKLEHYKQIPSLRHVLLIDQTEQLVEHYHHLDNAMWNLNTIRFGTIVLSDWNGEIAIEALYHLADFDTRT